MTEITDAELDSMEAVLLQRKREDPDHLYDNWADDEKLIAKVRQLQAEITRLNKLIAAARSQYD